MHLSIRLAFVLFCCVAARAYSSPAADAAPPPATKPLLTWAQNNAPPFFITEGPQAGEGFGGPLQRLLQKELPQFQHVTEIMPLKRLNQYWHAGANYCFVTMIHQPLPADADYALSIPNVYYRPHGIIARKNDPLAAKIRATYSSGRDVYPLENFLNATNISLGLMSRRSFGHRIDALLAQYQHRLDIFERSDADGLVGLFSMLKLGRVDYIIDYPFVFQFYDRQPDFRDQLQFIAVTETEDQSVWGAVGCSDNAWGADKLSAINSAIVRLSGRPEYRDLVLSWHAAPDHHEEYWQKLQQKILQSANFAALNSTSAP